MSNNIAEEIAILMIDVKMMQETIKLGKLYESRWGKEVDFIGMPPNLGQHNFCL